MVGVLERSFVIRFGCEGSRILGVSPYLRTLVLAALLAITGCESERMAPVSFQVRSEGDAPAVAARIALEAFGVARTGDRYIEDWQAAIQMVALDERKRALPLLEDLIASARFDQLNSAQQHAGLLLGGLVSLDQLDDSYAHRLFVRSTAMPEAILGDWSGRYVTASALGDRADALTSVATLLHRWPNEAADLSLDTLIGNIQIDPEGEQREAEFMALNALFDARFKERGAEPSSWWGILAAELVERGDLDRAARVVDRIDRPRTLLAMRVDRRFDALVEEDPQAFDIQVAARKQSENLERSVELYPRNLTAVLQLENAYFEAHRFADMLQTADTVISRVTAAGSINAVYDGVTTLRRIYRFRGLALEAMHRDDEAEAQYRSAADEEENFGGVLDLAEFYADRNRAADALAALRYLPGNDRSLAPYGRMEARLIRLTAAQSMNDRSEAQSCLTYLREHQSDSIDVFQVALVRADKSNEAAELITTRLKDPKLRRQALLEVQSYAWPIEPPVVRDANARWARILERPEVKAAIASVGRRERFEIPPQS